MNGYPLVKFSFCWGAPKQIYVDYIALSLCCKMMHIFVSCDVIWRPNNTELCQKVVFWPNLHKICRCGCHGNVKYDAHTIDISKFPQRINELHWYKSVRLHVKVQVRIGFCRVFCQSVECCWVDIITQLNNQFTNSSLWISCGDKMTHTITLRFQLDN